MTWRGLDIRWVVPRSEEGATAGRGAAAAWAGARLRRLGRLGLRLGRLRGLSGSRLGGLGGLRGALDPGGLDDVLLADPPADAGAGDALQVHGVLGGELADQRGDVGRLARPGQLGGRRVLLGLRVGRSPRRSRGRLLRGRLGLGGHLPGRGRIRRLLPVRSLAVRGRRGVGGRRRRGRAREPGRGRGGGLRGRRVVELRTLRAPAVRAADLGRLGLARSRLRSLRRRPLGRASLRLGGRGPGGVVRRRAPRCRRRRRR